MPGARRARSLVCEMKKHTSIVTTVTPETPETPGIPRANGFNGFLRARPGDRALLSPSSAQCAGVVANLISASGYQTHTTSPSARLRSRRKRRLRPPHPVLHVRDDRETPLL
jgi:hypothetical protein